LEINPPGAKEWVIKSWGNEWNIHPDEINDRLLAAEYLEKKGYHHTLVLKNNIGWVVGYTFLIHNNEAVWQVGWRNKDYETYAVGTRLMDISFEWAAKNGWSKIDLGGDHDYKLRWAPIDGEKHQFIICPKHILFMRRSINLIRKLKRAI
jgi:CelD/BcsL family acetyltransferase involved in cellulose biosynthesis